MREVAIQESGKSVKVLSKKVSNVFKGEQGGQCGWSRGVGDEVKGVGGHGFRAYIVHCTHFLFILSEGTIGEFLAETSDRT